jgi:hypothetical protein
MFNISHDAIKVWMNSQLTSYQHDLHICKPQNKLCFRGRFIAKSPNHQINDSTILLFEESELIIRGIDVDLNHKFDLVEDPFLILYGPIESTKNSVKTYQDKINL